MDKKFCMSMLVMLIVLPVTMRGVARAPEVILVTKERQFEVPEKVATLSKTIKRLIEDFPQEKKYVLPQRGQEALARVLPFMFTAYSVLYVPFKDRMKTVSSKIAEKLSKAPIERWLQLMNDIYYLDVGSLKQPLADSMIKYIYQQKNGNREQIEKFISDLTVPAVFKGLLAKYWYLNYGKDKNYIKLVEKEVPINYFFSVEELSAYKKLPEMSDEGRLDLDDLKINDLTGLSSIPRISSVSTLLIANNQLTKLTGDDFEGLNNLKDLHFAMDNVNAVPEDLLKYVKKLTMFGMEGNHLRSVPERLFNGVKQLRLVYLRANELQEIPEKLFLDNKQLVEVHLSNNKLKKLPKNIFKSNKELGFIKLGDNQLTEFPIDLIEGLTKLDWLDLSGNPITQANKDALTVQLGDKVSF